MFCVRSWWQMCKIVDETSSQNSVNNLGTLEGIYNDLSRILSPPLENATSSQPMEIPKEQPVDVSTAAAGEAEVEILDPPVKEPAPEKETSKLVASEADPVKEKSGSLSPPESGSSSLLKETGKDVVMQEREGDGAGNGSTEKTEQQGVIVLDD